MRYDFSIHRKPPSSTTLSDATRMLVSGGLAHRDAPLSLCDFSSSGILLNELRTSVLDALYL